MLNRIFRSFALLLVVGFLATLFFHEVYSESPPASQDYVKFEHARGKVDNIAIEITRQESVLQQMVDIQTAIVAAIGEIDKQGRMNAIQSIVGGFTGSEVAVVMALVSQIDQTTTALDMVPKLETLNKDIDYFYDNTITPIFTRGKATETHAIGYNLAWDNMINAYGNLQGLELQYVNQVEFGHNDQQNHVALFDAQKITITPPELITVKLCNGVCGSFQLDADKNKVTCPSCGVEYYSCDEKKAHNHQKPEGSDKYRCEPQLSVSFNDTNFGTGEELVVDVEIDGLYEAYMDINGKRRTSSRRSLLNNTKTRLRTTFTSDDVGYHEVKIIAVYYKDGRPGTGSIVLSSIEEVNYINVEKLGYFENSTSFSGYGTYKAEVFENEPIKEVYWYIKKPGGKWANDQHDEVNGGYSASWSYSLNSKSKSGTYKVHALVYLNRTDGKIKNYYSSFTVD